MHDVREYFPDTRTSWRGDAGVSGGTTGTVTLTELVIGLLVWFVSGHTDAVLRQPGGSSGCGEVEPSQENSPASPNLCGP